MRLFNRAVHGTACAAVILGMSISVVAQNEPSGAKDTNGTSGAGQRLDNDSLNSTALAELPDSPGAAWGKTQTAEQSQQQSGAGSEGNAGANPQTQNPPSTNSTEPDNKQNHKLQRPVGTAAAEAPKVNGVTAAQPAGVAIAPAKQRRVRTIVIKVGAIVGATAALGTVIALTAATPSKPPGAH